MESDPREYVPTGTGEAKMLSAEALATHNARMTSRRPAEKQSQSQHQPQKLSASSKTQSSNRNAVSSNPQSQVRNKQLMTVKDKKSDAGSERSNSTRKTPPDRRGAPATRGLQTMMMLKRKMSKWRTSKMSQVSMGSKSKSIVVLENTYKMEPTEDGKFCSWKVRQVMEDTLSEYLNPLECYNPHKSAALSRFLSEEIKSRIKALNYKRYKIAVHIVIGQNMEQGLQVASRAVWDPEIDDRATVTYKRADIFAVANLFATYFE